MRSGFPRGALATIVLALVAGCSSSNNSPSLPAVAQDAANVSSGTAAPLNQSVFGSASTVTSAGGPAAPPDPRVTLPPGATLPSDLECASRVVKATEIRPGNSVFNQTRGRQKDIREKWLDRVTGDFSGTTAEILQWAACKWGVDQDIVLAQAAKESYWSMTNLGDFGSDPTACPPGHGIGVDGKRGECPQSVGILQVRYPYHGPPARPTWPEAAVSTAYNVDYTYAVWRSCYEGDFIWLNTVDRGRDYAAGDAWGCVGLWFSGRWYTQPANEYIDDVRNYVRTRIWTTSSFITWR